MLSPSDDRTATSSSLHISVSDEFNSPIYASQIVSSPTADTRRPHHRPRGYSSDSTEFTEKLGSGEMSRVTRDMTLVAGSPHLSIDLSSPLSPEGTVISSPTSVKDQGIAGLIDVYPVAPEDFGRYEKRRKM
jgi:hypothetical protein